MFLIPHGCTWVYKSRWWQGCCSWLHRDRWRSFDMNHDLVLNGGGGRCSDSKGNHRNYFRWHTSATVISLQLFFMAHNGTHGAVICMHPIVTPWMILIFFNHVLIYKLHSLRCTYMDRRTHAHIWVPFLSLRHLKTAQQTYQYIQVSVRGRKRLWWNTSAP